MATHSSVLAWRIPGMGEPGGLPSMGSHRVGHDWSELAAAAAKNFSQSDGHTMISDFNVYIWIIGEFAYLFHTFSDQFKRFYLKNIMAWFSYNFLMLQEGGLLPGPESGLLSNTRQWIVQGDTYADKARDFMGKGHRVENSRQGNPGGQFCHGTHSLRCYGGGVSCLWTIILTQSPSRWHTSRSANMDSSKQDSGRLVGHINSPPLDLSPLDLSWILPAGGSLLVPDLVLLNNSCKRLWSCLARLGSFGQCLPWCWHHKHFNSKSTYSLTPTPSYGLAGVFFFFLIGG